VRVIGADEDASPPSQFLEPNKDVGLDILHQMAQVNMAIGVRQSRGDEHAIGRHEAPGRFVFQRANIVVVSRC
jgi:hypothetical protein